MRRPIRPSELLPDGAGRSETERPAGRADILVATCIASFLPPFMSSTLNLATTAMSADLRASALQVNWIVSAFLIASAACLLPFGRLGDMAGRKRLFVIGMTAYAAFSAACAVAPSATSLVALRAAQGAGGAIGFASSVAILAGAFPPGERGRVLGINSAAVYTGLSLGPVLGGVLTQHLGWRSVFLASAALGVPAVLLMALRVADEWRGAPAEEYDWWGALTWTASLAALMAGISTIKTARGGRWLALAGCAGLAAFVARELRARHPILDLGLFRNVVFAFSNLAALINYSATFAVGFLLSLYLQAARGLSPQSAGLILLIQPVLMAVLSPLSGRLSDRVEPRLVASVGMALTSLALALFAGLGAASRLETVAVGLALIGVGFGLFSSPNTNAVMSSVEARRYGVGAATLGTMRQVGQALSMSVVALVFAQVMGGARIGRESASLIVASNRAVFSLLAALCAAGVLASLARGRLRD
ncbi:MAG TPA: MFS transporter [Thermoanaerobaculaceae bacterium]|nr:MFS transporter [Thermoanaerobaculaceae bacterium]